MEDEIVGNVTISKNRNAYKVFGEETRRGYLEHTDVVRG